MVSHFDLYGSDLAAGSEKALLHAHLRLARDNLVFKVEGLSEADRRRPMAPSGTNLIGVIKHMTWIESWYLCDAFGRDRPQLPWEQDVDASYFMWSDMYAKPEETTDELLAAYQAANDAADASIEGLDLDTIGQHPMGMALSLRSLLLIVLIDTSRHAGHSDIVRELIDGSTGSRHAPSGFEGANADHQAAYLARVRGEIDTDAWGDYIRSLHEPKG